MFNKAVIGIDAGGTKTLGVCASLDSKLLKSALAGGANHQIVGFECTERVLGELFLRLVKEAEESGYEIAAYCFGISGLDREKDERLLGELTNRIVPYLPGHLCNDTFLILRAGTADGIGVAVVSGTGPNCVGVGRDGTRHRVGGLLSELGDYGGSYDLAIDALRASRRGKDGRGEWTILHDMIVSRLGLSEIEDMADYCVTRNIGAQVIEEITKMIFEAANMDDSVAIGILTRAGTELGLCARLVAEKLFKPHDEFPLIMGGSVLQKGASPHFRETIAREVKKTFPAVRPAVLDCAPALGAVMYAIDSLERVAGLPDGWDKWDFHQWLKGEMCLT